MSPSSYLFFRGFLASWLLSKENHLQAVCPCPLSPTFWRIMSRSSRRRAARQSPALISSLSGSMLRSLCRVTYFSMWLSMLSWLCLSFCARCKVIQVSLCFLDWIISKLCRLYLTDLVENDAEGVLMYIYWTFFFFLSSSLFLVFKISLMKKKKISLMLLEVHCTVEYESC